MAREYLVNAVNITPTAAATSTVVFVNVGPTTSLEFLRMWLSQGANATSAQQRCQISTQVTAFPTLASTTPAKTKLLDPVSAIIGGTAGAAGTSGTLASAEGAGAKTVLYPDAFNVLNGWLWVPTPRETLILNAGGASGMGLVLTSTPSPTSGWNAGMIFSELG